MQMNSQKAERNHIEISIIGAGIAGITTAFHLRNKGYKVNLIDQKLKSKINTLSPRNGTEAALGVLMGNIYKKSKGKAFLRRSRSMKLWKTWLTQLDPSQSNIQLEKPLIKLADSEKEYQSMINVSEIKKEYGIKLLDQVSIEFWSSVFEKKLIGGLISYEDSRLHPIKLIKLFLQYFDKTKVNKIEQSVTKISKNINSLDKNWKINLENNEYINTDYIIICAALSSQKLIKPLGHTILLEPILGQVVELKLKNKTTDWNKWPGVLNYQSINFIHHNLNHIIMGATIESGNKASLRNKQKMLYMNNTAPKWIKQAKISNEWSGVRAKPIGEPAPLLKELEPGLLINTGHYRNGILLAPFCAEWIALKIKENK